MFVEIAIVVVLVAVFGVFLFTSWTSRRLPPGPRAYPIIGNATDIQGCDVYQALTNLSKKYGGIFSLTFPGGQKAVIVNTGSILREALLTKKDDFSGRPYTFIGDLVTRGSKDIICADFTPTMVSLRKIVHSALKMYGQGMQRLENHICSEADDLAKRLVDHHGTPFNPKADISVTVMNVICAIVYGQSYHKHEEEFQQIVDYNDTFAEIFGNFNILDLLPWLRHFPSQTMKRLTEARDIRDEILNKKYYEHKEKFQIENANNNFQINDLTDALLKACADNAQENGKEAISEDNIIMTMNDIFNAGFETTATILQWVILYLMHYPAVQEKVHRELDDVIGHGRLPRLKDRENLPYTRAMIAETLRITSHVPLALPHKATRDTTLAGYDIPKGYTLIANIWAIHHNPSEWKNPEMYLPERFIDENGKFDTNSNKDYLPFSTGRRNCVGQSLAKSEVFLLTARMLHQFSFTKPSDQPLPSLEGKQGVVLHPLSFKAVAEERA